MTEPPPPPSGPPPPTGPPPDFPAGPDPQRRPPAVSVGLAVLGVLAVVPMSFLLIFLMEGAGTELGVRAGIFAGLVFLGGGGLCFVSSPQARGFGIGLMTGWALLSITTAGVCTGLQKFIL
ncbi:MAG: hypothetical protein WKF57_11755 [Nakamurella sp.]